MTQVRTSAVYKTESWLEAVLRTAGTVAVIGIISLILWQGLMAMLAYLPIAKAEGSECVENLVLSTDIKIQDATPSNQDTQQDLTESFIRYANPKLTNNQVASISTYLKRWAEYYHLPLGLVVGVAHAESNFRLTATGKLVSGNRAVGAMQVMWPMHQKLAKRLGVKSKEEMFGEYGVKVGCYILKSYIDDEQSIIGGLKSYLSALSRTYILEKIIVDWLVLEQLEAETISIEELSTFHQTEKQYMRKLLRK